MTVTKKHKRIIHSATSKNNMYEAAINTYIKGDYFQVMKYSVNTAYIEWAFTDKQEQK